MTGDLVALDWTQYDPQTAQAIGSGTSIGRHEGQLPSNIPVMCDRSPRAAPTT
jgi:hypothetical protein